VVGFDGDLSGPFAISGAGELKGIEAYFEAVNKAGGLHGRQVKVVALDDGSDPNRMLANIQQLLTQDHVQAMIGITISSLCEAAQPVLAKAQMPIVCTATGPSQVTGSGASPWVFQAQTEQDHQVGPAIDTIKDVTSASAPRVGLIYYNSDSHIGFANNLTASLQKLGWPLVAREVVPLVANPPIVDMATAIANAHPTVVVSLMVTATAPLFYQTLRSHGFTGPIIQNPDAGISVLSQTKEPNTYFLNNEYVNNTPSMNIGGLANWQKMQADLAAFGTNSTVAYVPRGYEAALTLGTAMQACGDCTGSKLATALAGVRVPTNGITPGNLYFTSTNHAGEQAMVAYYWHDGALQLFKNNLPATTGP
jgi:branched-chain amino acid transport system substrate-binding protein